MLQVYCIIISSISHFQAGTDAIYANINSAFDRETQQNGILKKPYRIEIHKSDVIANYRVYYRGVSPCTAQ